MQQNKLLNLATGNVIFMLIVRPYTSTNYEFSLLNLPKYRGYLDLKLHVYMYSNKPCRVNKLDTTNKSYVCSKQTAYNNKPYTTKNVYNNSATSLVIKCNKVSFQQLANNKTSKLDTTETNNKTNSNALLQY